VEFAVGFLVGFVGPLAGVGGGVLFTPLAVGLLGVDVNLARTGGLLVAMTTSSVAGSFQAGGCESYLCGGGCVAGCVSGGPPRLVSGGRWGDRWAEEVGLGVLWWFLSCWVGGWSGLRGVSTGSLSGLGLWGSFGRGGWGMW
jgi:hypothetical protein